MRYKVGETVWCLEFYESELYDDQDDDDAGIEVSGYLYLGENDTHAFVACSRWGADDSDIIKTLTDEQSEDDLPDIRLVGFKNIFATKAEAEAARSKLFEAREANAE